MKTIINKARLVTLPIIRNHIEKYRPNEVRSMGNMDENVQSDQSSSYQRTKQMNPNYDTTPFISKVILSSVLGLEFLQNEAKVVTASDNVVGFIISLIKEHRWWNPYR